jgi:hypothetical protein
MSQMSCDICNRVVRLCRDHDHVTGRSRGLLCGECNMGLGKFRDTPALLEKAAEYLRHHSKPLPEPDKSLDRLSAADWVIWANIQADGTSENIRGELEREPRLASTLPPSKPPPRYGKRRVIPSWKRTQQDNPLEM